MAKTGRYRLLTGLNYPAGAEGLAVRREAGDVVDDLPPKAVRRLLERGHIEPIEPAAEGER